MEMPSRYPVLFRRLLLLLPLLLFEEDTVRRSTASPAEQASTGMESSSTGSHVTDRGCLNLRRKIRYDSWPPPCCTGGLLSPQDFVRISPLTSPSGEWPPRCSCFHAALSRPTPPAEVTSRSLMATVCVLS